MDPIARAYGQSLPRYAGPAIARRKLLGLRDESLAHLRRLSRKSAEFEIDGAASSLLSLEKWYFALIRSRSFGRIGTTRTRFEQAMGFYAGEVAVRTRRWKWRVRRYPFVEGRYEIGVESPDGLQAVMGIDGMCVDWFETPRNVRQTALHRRFLERWPSTAKLPSPPRLAPAGDRAIEAAIRQQLRRKSSSLVHPGELAVLVKHRLRHEARVRRADVLRVAAALLARRILERVPMSRGTGFRYRLKRRENRSAA